MADIEDQNATLPEIDGLPDLNADSSDLPDLGGGAEIGDLPDLSADGDFSNDLPDLDMGAGGDLPDLGAAADPMDLGGDIDMPLEDLGGNDLDLSDLKSPVSATGGPNLNELSTRRTPDMTTAVSTPSGDSIMAFKKIQGIKVKVQVMLGETRLSVSQLANLKKGEFVQLDTKVGEPVDILANGALIARGEIAVEDEDTPRFGITLTEIIDSSVLAS